MSAGPVSFIPVFASPAVACSVRDPVAVSVAVTSLAAGVSDGPVSETICAASDPPAVSPALEIGTATDPGWSDAAAASCGPASETPTTESAPDAVSDRGANAAESADALSAPEDASAGPVMAIADVESDPLARSPPLEIGTATVPGSSVADPVSVLVNAIRMPLSVIVIESTVVAAITTSGGEPSEIEMESDAAIGIGLPLLDGLRSWVRTVTAG